MATGCEETPLILLFIFSATSRLQILTFLTYVCLSSSIFSSSILVSTISFTLSLASGLIGSAPQVKFPFFILIATVSSICPSLSLEASISS